MVPAADFARGKATGPRTETNYMPLGADSR